LNLTGWLFDVFEDPADGAAVWLLGDDGRRLRLRQGFPAAMCVRGEENALAALRKHLLQRFPGLSFRREARRDVFERREVEVLAVEAPRVSELRAVLRAAARAFPNLEYSNADLALSLLYAARTGLSPLSRCRLAVDGAGWIREYEALDSPWDMQHAEMKLRTLSLMLEPTRSGQGSESDRLLARCGQRTSAPGSPAAPVRPRSDPR